MKSKIFPFLIIGLLCFPLYFPLGAKAALFSGAYLLELCKRNDTGGEVVKGGHTACQAYISGIIDYHRLLRSLGTSPSIDFCIPENVTPNDLQDIVWNYLSNNAQNDAFIAAPSVSLALFEVFPCEDG